jgi:hypothetical protein
MSVDECRSLAALCIQLFKLVWASMCGCSHHGDALMCRVGHERLRPRPSRDPSWSRSGPCLVRSASGLRMATSRGLQAQAIPWRSSARWYAGDT